MKHSILSLMLVATTITACSKQEPVDVVDGYSQTRTTYTNPADRAFDLQSEAIALSQMEEKYFVHGGDKLDQIAKHFGVRSEAILARNNIKTEMDLPKGKYITIPSPNWKPNGVQWENTSSYRLTDKYRAENETSVVSPQKQVAVQANTAMRTHVLKRGENIYRIALKYNVSQFDILAANDIRDPSDLMPGMLLNIPATGDAMKGRDTYKRFATPVKTPTSTPIAKPTAAKANTVFTQRSVPATQKMRPNTEAPKLTAPTENVDRYTALSNKYKRKITSGKGMTWPADGKLIKTFGNKGDGVNETGINIALAQDAPIYVAESGTVIYADDGLELYGNLILVRHANGYVTAYGHNAKNIVKRHQKVTKGDLIAFAGNTGNVDQTQLHFEVRRNAQPINPMKVLPRR